MRKKSNLDYFSGDSSLANISGRGDLGKSVKGKEPGFADWLDILGNNPIPKYRNPKDISRAPRLSTEGGPGHITLQQIQDAWREKGHMPFKGLNLGDDKIISEFTPETDKEKNYLVDEENQGQIDIEVLTGREQKLGKAMGLLADQTLSSQDMDNLIRVWNAGKKGFTDALTFVTKKLAKVKQDLRLDLGFSATNFETNYPLLGGKIKELAEERMGQIEGIEAAFAQRHQQQEDGGESEVSEFSQLQINEYKRLKQELSSEASWDNQKEWLNKLSLVYGGNFNVIADNPLGLPYPNSFQQLMDVYKAFMKQKTPRAKTPEPGLDEVQRSFMERDIPNVDFSPAEAAERRQYFKNIQKYQGLANQFGDKISSFTEGQYYSINYDKEKKNLEQIVHALDVLSEKLQNPQKNVSTIDKIMSFLIFIVNEYYSNTQVVTKEGKFDNRFALGNESRFAIYLGVLALAKNYTPWRARISEIPPEQDLNQLMEAVRGGQLIAQQTKAIIKIANKLDDQNKFTDTDSIMEIINLLL